VEIDPLYLDVIVRRFEAITRKQGILVDTNETFEALTIRRIRLASASGDTPK
jgi:hypothetical protein